MSDTARLMQGGHVIQFQVQGSVFIPSNYSRPRRESFSRQPATSTSTNDAATMPPPYTPPAPTYNAALPTGHRRAEASQHRYPTQVLHPPGDRPRYPPTSMPNQQPQAIPRSASQPRGHHAYAGYASQPSRGGGPSGSGGNGGGGSHSGARHYPSRSFQPHAPPPRTLAEEEKKNKLIKDAKETMQAITHGYYIFRDATHPNGKTRIKLKVYIDRCMADTKHYTSDDVNLSAWYNPKEELRTPHSGEGGSMQGVGPGRFSSSSSHSSPRTGPNARPTLLIQIMPMSTVEGVCWMDGNITGALGLPIGVLNFASAHKAGGGWLNGASAQEESLTRASTLFASLDSTTAKPFYDSHRKDDRGGLYTHDMIWSPSASVFKDDRGYTIKPIRVDVVSSPAVNAGQVRLARRRCTREEQELRIQEVMHERMGRILALFELYGVRNIVLGSFGTGVFKNDVQAVATIWAQLLDTTNARFRNSFDNVLFAIPDHATVQKYHDSFPSAPRPGAGSSSYGFR